jgi:hypothetical protein
MHGTSDLIISKCVGVLDAAACSEDHPASKCAALIQDIQTLWDNRDKMFITTPHPFTTKLGTDSKPSKFYGDQSTVMGSIYDTVEANLQLLYKGVS